MAAAQPGAGAAAALKKVVPSSTPDTSSLTSLQYAAEGVIRRAMEIGADVRDGDGVTQDDLRAFEYFSRIANAMPKTARRRRQSAIVANAFCRVGALYLNGIPNSKIKSDPERAGDVLVRRVLFSATPTRNMICRL